MFRQCFLNSSEETRIFPNFADDLRGRTEQLYLTRRQQIKAKGTNVYQRVVIDTIYDAQN